jgi:hypothetical protein
LRLQARAATSRAARQSGQGLAEFALVVPIMFFLVVVIADFGRVFTAMVGTESAAREAADYGAFVDLDHADRWASANSPWTATEDEMQRRACTAMLEQSGFSDTTGNCVDNPIMTWELLTRDSAAALYHIVDKDRPMDDCYGRDPHAARGPCVVHVTVSFNFSPIFAVPPIPSSVTISRESWFALSELTGS